VEHTHAYTYMKLCIHTHTAKNICDKLTADKP